MIVWTVPYLALQPLAGGLVLGELFGMPQLYGALLVTAIIVLYTIRGGMRAVAWTDAFQGLMMLVLLFAALCIVVAHHGGFGSALGQVLRAEPGAVQPSRRPRRVSAGRLVQHDPAVVLLRPDVPAAVPALLRRQERARAGPRDAASIR